MKFLAQAEKLCIRTPLIKLCRPELVKVKHGEVILGNDMWSPDINVYNILKEIQTLLGSPDVVNETTITNPEAAKLFQENFEEYKKRVLKCVEESLREDKTSDIQQYQTEDEGTWQVLAQLELSRRRNILTNS